MIKITIRVSVMITVCNKFSWIRRDK